MEDKLRRDIPRNTKSHPQQRAGLVSKLFFCWALPFFFKGWQREISENDLYRPLKNHESKRLGDKLEAAWHYEKIKYNNQNPSLRRALIKVFGVEMALYGFLLFITEFGIKMSQPLLIGKLLEYFSPQQTKISMKEAYLYASLIVLTIYLNIIMGYNTVMCLQPLGMKIRLSLSSLIYRKSLRLSKSALAETSIGQLVNLLSNDIGRFDLAMIDLHHLWLAPSETLVIIYLLYVNLGITSIYGVGILALFAPLQFYTGKKTSAYRLKTALRTDERVRLMNEIISGIQVIKMYTWEKPFAKLVEIARKLEIKQIKNASYLHSIFSSLMMILNRMAIFTCVLAYVLTGNTLNSQYVYVATAYYGILREALTVCVPKVVTVLAETKVSLLRVQKFLMSDEIDNTLALTLSNRTSYHIGGVHIENVSVKWNENSPDFVLSDINFDVNEGELIAIIGPVGCGKTTLLHVILNELPLKMGTMSVVGEISYASQEPWLFAGSIRQNILFGQEMDIERYREVIKVCALERDFSLFPYGDRTLVGERGVMLSGGQKARINLARAVYKKADIYLLDDPLSAVDTRVGKQLFEECIRNFLKDKCVVLVTHQLQHVSTASRIYLIENGTVSMSGSYEEIKSNNNAYLQRLESIPKDTQNEDTDLLETSKISKDVASKDLPVEVKEKQNQGAIKRSVYKTYISAGGNIFFLIAVILLFISTQLLATLSDYFLTFWLNLEQRRFINSKTSTNITTDINNIKLSEEWLTPKNCLYLYFVFIMSLVIITISRSLSLYKFALNASTKLHNTMFSKIVFAPMRFFNTNQSGRILNRFSKDIGLIDEILPFITLDSIQIALVAIAIAVVVIFMNYWMFLPTLIILCLLYCYLIVFLSTTRNLKRIEGTNRSPIFTHLNASLQGLTTIRAFGAQDILINEFDQHQDNHTSVFYMIMSCSRTLGFWIDSTLIVYIALLAFSFLFIGSEIYDANVGLAITQSLGLTGILSRGMRQLSELQNQMTCVERVVEYTEIVPEDDSGKKIPPKDWPQEGNVEFEELSLQYSIDEPFVLKRISFFVKSGEKVGIVGRTGAGKSSLISALFRLAPTQGKIIIDGINTSDIPLQNLRQIISIIPQEPVLFSGTLKKNLDPFDQYSDELLWRALDEVEMKAPISDLPGGLHSKVSEGGSNFSVGQRQLLCLARAILRNNRILVLDEATANIDPHTDELIQNTIRRKFQECTVLTIAHRLNTVMDSDKILVIKDGRAEEFDSPQNLLRDSDSIFYGLVTQTGLTMAKYLTSD